MKTFHKSPARNSVVFGFLLTLALFLVSCSSLVEESAISEALKPVKDQYAPDTRVAVFKITVNQEKNNFVVKGEVENPLAKEAALSALAKISKKTVIDSVVVLPASELGENQYGIVSVSVGNMRGEPKHPAELVTQVMMGSVLRILKQEGGWFYVQAPDKYLGWIDRDAVFQTTLGGVEDWIQSPKVITTEYFSIVYEKPTVDAKPVSDVVMGALLKKRGMAGKWIEVEIPDGRKGFVHGTSLMDYSVWKNSRKLTAGNIEDLAKKFIGVPYLWGGTSPKGFDCSGYTKTVFRLNGIDLQRDANQQATMGEEPMVGDQMEHLKKGDLLFFGRKATEEKPERIWHVGIYLGNQEFIHCAGKVRVNSFDPEAPHYDPERLKTFVRARRLIGVSQIPEIG